MIRIVKNIALLIMPFLMVVLINELVRSSANESGYLLNGVSAINSAEKHTDKCSWHCHSNTTFCKENHVKLAKPFFNYTDAAYFGLINLLQKTGSYVLANLFFLVALLPLLIWFFIVKSFNIQTEIKTLKKS